MRPPPSSWPALAVLGGVAWAAGVWRPTPPLNDDWMYRLAAERLAADGTLVLSGYGAATQVLHVAGAAAWSMATGGAAWGLYSTLCAAVAVWNLAAFIEESGGPRPAAALAAASLVLCPVTLVSLPGLMTELPFLALGTLALRSLARGAASGAARDLAVGGAWTAAAYLVRQPALGLPLGAAWFLWRGRRLDARRLAALWGPSAAAVLGHALWKAASPESSPSDLHVGARVLPFLMDLAGSLPAVSARVLSSVPTLGLFALPLAAALPAGAAGRPRGAGRAAWAVLASCALVTLWKGPLPLLGNIVARTGLGAVSLPGFADKAAGFYAWGPLWWALTAAASGAAAWSAASIARSAPSAARATALGAALGQLALPLLNDMYLDRYLLPALPGLLAAAALGASGARLSLVRGWAAAAALAGLWVPGLLDHLAWNEARWTLADAGAARLGGPCAVNGGYEWNARWCYAPAMARLAALKPAAAIAPDEWFSADPRRAFLSFSPDLESPQVALLGDSAYATPLGRTGGRLYLYALSGPAPRPSPAPPPDAGDGTGAR